MLFGPWPLRLVSTMKWVVATAVPMFAAYHWVLRSQVLKSLGERFGVPVIREHVFGQDYAKTLATWRNNFRAAWPNLMPLGFDDRFRRLWEYYLAYCEAGFAERRIGDVQLLLTKPCWSSAQAPARDSRLSNAAVG